MTTILNHGASWRFLDSKKQFNEAYKQMFSNLAGADVDELKSLTDRYHKYHKHIKHISFKPDYENLSNFFHDLNSKMIFDISSICVGTSTT